MLAFALLGLAVSSVTPSLRLRLAGLVALLAGAFAIEWGEFVIYRLIFEWQDVYADALGIAFGAMVYVLLRELRRT